ncbi:conserved hypothetical protein [Histoplasma capsulatum H143]|uniref:Uncharacterized protein n=1 Tax=Ajellomyces capsulatus (strain H143) TaxID=544712 RepID=C6HGY7_AJECH|nr:conserved hypothetical protein [Histoplasma capsulatum H143]
MALKRKASFTTITSPRPHSSSIYLNRDQTSPTPMPFLGTATITVDEPPRHLHSRTRKRFRNDRPDEQTIYAAAAEYRRTHPGNVYSGSPQTTTTTTTATRSEPTHAAEVLPASPHVAE